MDDRFPDDAHICLALLRMRIVDADAAKASITSVLLGGDWTGVPACVVCGGPPHTTGGTWCAHCMQLRYANATCFDALRDALLVRHARLYGVRMLVAMHVHNIAPPAL